jgi:predicted ATPase/class 3 adenylate cyclase
MARRPPSSWPAPEALSRAVDGTTIQPSPNALPRVTVEPSVATFLFTDIEGSTRLWEREPDRMRVALADHDRLCRDSVHRCGGHIVKSTGDGIHAVFADAVDALNAVLDLQQALTGNGVQPDPASKDGTRPGATPLELRVRCGLHCGDFERRDGDFYGPVLNRAARVMSIAHGGQTLLSQAVAEQVTDRLPPEVELQDLGSVRLRDLTEPERVYQLLHPALRRQFPPLRSLEATPNNLPQQLNSFVGREQELADVRQLLQRTRLLTLLGMGGIGKSRLSVQLGADLLDEHGDGVWLVELAPLTDARLVPQALATVLGVKEGSGQTVIESLLAHVRDKSMLVILDNCEHVVQACADLAKQLLQTGAGLKVLASSRDVLQVAGETTYQVPTLSVPEAQEDIHAAIEVDRLSRHEAVRLFVDRASAAQSRFRLTPDNAAAVAAICHRLDGIPLAIELAAARTRALSVQAIATRLKDRFRLLVTADQTVLPRQRTLRALIDWSFDLLSEPERQLFRRLAVFAGGWSLDAAEAIGADEGLVSDDVLDLLAQLVGKSLVVMEPGGERYRMLETVRAYAAEKLAEAQDEVPTRRRHVAHFLDFAAATPQRLTGADQGVWLQCLDRERENLLLAHDWCGRLPDCAEQGLELVFVLKNYWRMRGLLGLGHRVTSEALARTQPGDRSFGRCRVLCDTGQLCYFTGRYAEARQHLEESLAIARDLGDARRMAAAMQALGTVYGVLGETGSAQAMYEQTLLVAHGSGYSRLVVAATNSLAQLHRASGRLSEAEALYARVIALAREQEDLESVAIGLLNQAMVSISRQQVDHARPMLAEVRTLAAQIGSRPVEQSLLEVCAGLSAADQDPQRAARLFGAAEARAQRTGLRRDANDDRFLMPLMAAVQAQLDVQDYQRLLADGRDGTDDELASDLDQVLQLEAVSRRS